MSDTVATRRVLVVGVGDGAAYDSIADALRVAQAGDVLALHPGVYEEVVKVTHDVTLTTVAAHAATATAAATTTAAAATGDDARDGGHAAEDAVATGCTTPTPVLVPAMTGCDDSADVETIIAGDVIVAAAHATLRGLQVRGRVDVRSGHATIEHCDIHHGSSGVRVGAQCTLTMTSCRVHHCSSDGDGVYFMPTSSGEVTNTDVYECRVNGVHARHAHVVLRDNRLRDCLFGVYYRDAASGLVQDNTIEHMAKFGVYVVEDSDPVVRANVVRECGVQCVLVSQGGRGVWSDNTVDGSMHIRAGCHARVGDNRVAGRLDVDAPTQTSTPTAMATAVAATTR